MQTKDIQNLYVQSPKLNQLNILREVSAESHVTQAELANLCSLSVAMVNNYMKELCSCGLLEYRRKSSKSVAYFLTPSGQRHLEALQMELIHEMASIFETAKEQIRAHIVSRVQTSLQRVVLIGSGNLAQLAFHALEKAGASIVGVFDENPEMVGHDFCGREVLNPSQIRFLAPDAVIVADSVSAEEICRNLESLADCGINIIRLDCCTKQKPAEIPKTELANESPDGLENERMPQ
jgi:predicted transcriptional regulator